MRETIKSVLMSRDGLTSEEAEEAIEEAKEALQDYLDSGNFDDAYNICQEFFGLEPDYLDDLVIF